MQITSDIHFIEGRGTDCNVYAILGDKITLVDTGIDPTCRSILEYLRSLGLDPANIENVVLTHVHVDHIGGLPRLVRKFEARVHVFEAEADLIENADERITLSAMSGGKLPPVHVDVRLQDHQLITFGAHDFEVINTPGHTAGAICLYDRANKILFSGDTVFPDGNFGRVDFPTGDPEALIASLEALVALDVEIMLPGHMEPVLSGGSRQIALSLRMARMMRGGF